MTRIVQRAVCVACAVLLGLAAAVPTQQLEQPQPSSEDGVGGLGTVLFSVLDDCFGGDGDAMVCLKTRALTALDRALAKPAVTLADGVSLAARAGKSAPSPADPQAERAGRAALDAAEGPERKNALLDDMLADRLDRLMSTRTIVLDAAADQEGRGKKKDKQMKQAMMMAGMMAVAVMGPMVIKMIALLAGKALILAKIALVLSGITALKKLLQQQQKDGGESESSHHHYGRSLRLDAAAADAAHDAAYSAQKRQ